MSSSPSPSSTSFFSISIPVIASADTINSIVAINSHITLKLNATNYAAWRFQFNTVLHGFGLQGYVNGTLPCPEASSDSQLSIDRLRWERQDQLILSAISSSMSPELVPFISSTSTSKEAWDLLSNTYAKPSRGRINSLKQELRTLKNNSLSITAYMQRAKVLSDELALLNNPVQPDDLILSILGGLDDSYKDISSAIEARETIISFDELHEKLLNVEAKQKGDLTSQPATLLPATALTVTKPPPNPNTNPNHFKNRNSKCQICGEQGHPAKKCPTFYFLRRNQSN